LSFNFDNGIVVLVEGVSVGILASFGNRPCESGSLLGPESEPFGKTGYGYFHGRNQPVLILNF